MKSSKQHPANYWTKDKCIKEALKYNNKQEFKRQSKAYAAAYRLGWIQDVCAHMKPGQHAPWTFEECKIEALKFKYKVEFRNKSHKAFFAAYKRGWLSDICKHMEEVGNRYKKMVYAYEFSDKTVYIGLTCNEERRHKEHTSLTQIKSKSPVFEYINKTGFHPLYKKITKDYIEVIEAQAIEAETLEFYKKEGWKALNKAKTGGVGGEITFWTREICEEKAKVCKTRSEFQHKFSSAYSSSHKQGWLDEICSHMPEIIKPNGYWTKEQCAIESLKYNSRKQFSLESISAYDKARENKWLNDICKHMTELRKPNNYWTKEICAKEAKKYNSKLQFRKLSHRAYDKAYKSNWLNEICSHMTEGRKSTGFWTKENCKKEALKFGTIKEFNSESASAYNKACKSGWLQEICTHMIREQRPPGYWTKDNCLEEALKYKTFTQFRKLSGSAYNSANKNNWLNEIHALYIIQ